MDFLSAVVRFKIVNYPTAEKIFFLNKGGNTDVESSLLHYRDQ